MLSSTLLSSPHPVGHFNYVSLSHPLSSLFMVLLHLDTTEVFCLRLLTLFNSSSFGYYLCLRYYSSITFVLADLISL